jgi:hypothetical protein
MKLSKDLISSLVYIHYTNRSVDYLTADKLKSLGLIESKPNKEVLTSLGIELLNNMDIYKLLNSLSKDIPSCICYLYMQDLEIKDLATYLVSENDSIRIAAKKIMDKKRS